MAQHEFKVNEYMMLKLEGSETVLYVAGEKFIQCRHLLLVLPPDQIKEAEEINSIDDIPLFLKNNSKKEAVKLELPPETEFWGHCSNLQAWYEHMYDTRLLFRSLAFPLLKRLTEVGDVKAKRVFKEEIAQRILEGSEVVVTYLVESGYLGYLDVEELESLKSQLPRRETDIIKKALSEKFESLFKYDLKTQGVAEKLDALYRVWEVIYEEGEEFKIENVEYRGKRYYVYKDELSIERVEDIKAIRGLERLRDLKKLNLRKGTIQKIEGLENLHNLVLLDLSFNRICKIENLKNLTQLREIIFI